MRHHLWIIGVLIAFALGLVWLLAQPEPELKRLASEGEGIETASAIGFGLCALAVWARTRTAAASKVMVSVLMLVLVARELDLDKSQFTRGLFKSSQYLRGDVPVGEKLIGALILLAIAGCLIALIRREWATLRDGLRVRHAGIAALGVAAVFAAIAKSLDGIARKLEPLGIVVDEGWIVPLQGTEELMELTIAALLLVAVLVPWRGRR